MKKVIGAKADKQSGDSTPQSGHGLYLLSTHLITPQVQLELHDPGSGVLIAVDTDVSTTAGADGVTKTYFPHAVTVVGGKLFVLATVNLPSNSFDKSIIIYDDATDLTTSRVVDYNFAITKNFLERAVCIAQDTHLLVAEGASVVFFGDHFFAYVVTRYDTNNLGGPGSPAVDTILIKGVPNDSRDLLRDLALTQDESKFLFVNGRAGSIGTTPTDAVTIWQCSAAWSPGDVAAYTAQAFYREPSYQVNAPDGDLTNARLESEPQAMAYDKITGHVFVLWDPAQSSLPTIIDEIDGNGNFVHTWIPRTALAPTPAIVSPWTDPTFQPYTNPEEWMTQGQSLGQVMQASAGILWVNFDLYWDGSSPGGIAPGPAGRLEDAVWRIDTTTGVGESEILFRAQTNPTDRATTNTASYVWDMRIGGGGTAAAMGTASTPKMKVKSNVQHGRVARS